MTYRIIKRSKGKEQPLFILQVQRSDYRNETWWEEVESSYDFDELESKVLAKRVTDSVVKTYNI